MKHILLRFADASEPALSGHDSVVLNDSDGEFAKETMQEVHHSFFVYPPVIQGV